MTILVPLVMDHSKDVLIPSVLILEVVLVTQGLKFTQTKVTYLRMGKHGDDF